MIKHFTEMKTGPKPKRVSIHEVAKKSACSIATVSNVLNGKGRVGEAQRLAVLEAVKTLGYVADISGRSLRMGRSETIGLLFYPSCAKLFRNPFYAEVMEALEEEFAKKRYNLLLAGYNISKSYSDLPIQYLRGRVDGVVLVGGFPTEVIEELSTHEKCLILLDTDADNLPLDSVVSDGIYASKLVVSHLAGLGHTRILMAAYKMDDYNIDMRIRGFEQAVQRHNLSPKHCTVSREYLYDDEIAADLLKRMQTPDRPTAIYAVNDTMALALKTALEIAGYRIPEDVSIVGFDDDEFSARTKPALTTVRVDRANLGRTGAELIFRRVEKPDAPVTKMRITTELVVRETTAPPSRTTAKKPEKNSSSNLFPPYNPRSRA